VQNIGEAITEHADIRDAVQREQEKPEPTAERLASESSSAETRLARSAVRADWAAVEAVCARSLNDLNALQFEAEANGHRVSVPAAGIPWYLETTVIFWVL